MALISKIPPKCIDEALQDQSWIEGLQEKLNKFEKEQSLDSSCVT